MQKEANLKRVDTLYNQMLYALFTWTELFYLLKDDRMCLPANKSDTGMPCFLSNLKPI